MKKLILAVIIIACIFVFSGCPVPHVGDTEQKWECELAKLYFDLSIDGYNGFYLNNANELIAFTVEAATEFAYGNFTIIVDQDVLPWGSADYLRTLNRYLVEGRFLRSGSEHTKMELTSYSNDKVKFFQVPKMPEWLEGLVD